jgi:hypothetical protein
MTKAEVSRRQLGAALHLYLDECDPVSVHTLACGGREIAGELAKAQSASAFQFLAGYGTRRPEWSRAANHYWNSFKHASTHDGELRSDASILSSFHDSVNDGVLFVGWYDLGLAGYPLPVAAQLQTAWYIYRHSAEDDLKEVGPTLNWPPLNEARRLIGIEKHAEQKAMLRASIRLVQEHGWVADDPRTDLSPLILPFHVPYPSARSTPVLPGT